MSSNAQTQKFNDVEGDAWFKRNMRHVEGMKAKDDLIFETVKGFLIKNGKSGFAGCRILEVGCSNGYRLNWMKNKGAIVTGFDPGAVAIDHGKEQYGMTSQELFTADARHFFSQNSKSFDVIIFGHCLYLVPPAELPTIVSGCIETLDEGGIIIIYDFDSVAQRQAYHHADNIWSYKMEYDKLFTGFPQMKLIEKQVFQHDQSVSWGNPKEDCALSIIKKIDVNFAYPILEGSIST